MDSWEMVFGWLLVIVLMATLGAWLVMLLVPLAVAGAFTISFVQALAISLLAGILFGSRK